MLLTQPRNRSLVDLDRGGSTYRVLNLNRVHRRLAEAGRRPAPPLFANPKLDRAIILKHQLRPHERELFAYPRSMATKVILPIDRQDLRLGGRSFFVSELQYETLLASQFGSSEAVEPRDRAILDILDGLPSLDPFLLREALGRNDISADIEYFDISEADLRAMREVVEADIARLAELASAPGSASILTDKLLFIEREGYAPLREALQLSDAEYSEGLFAWRGLLYYKWTWRETMKQASRTYLEITGTSAKPPRAAEAEARIRTAIQSIDRCVGLAFREVNDILELYNSYYDQFIQGQDAAAFKNFVLSAPGMFYRSGELIGGVNHFVSYWKYRSTEIFRNGISHADFADLLADFETSLLGAAN